MLRCPLCRQQSITTHSIATLECHLFVDHFGHLPYECVPCMRRFPTEYSFHDHHRHCHNGCLWNVSYMLNVWLIIVLFQLRYIGDIEKNAEIKARVKALIDDAEYRTVSTERAQPMFVSSTNLIKHRNDDSNCLLHKTV